MKIENTVVNQNDNAEFLGDVYLGTDEYGDKSRRLQWRDTALRLIQKYLPSYRKSRQPERDIAEKAIVETIDRAYQDHIERGRHHSTSISMYILAIFLDMDISLIQFFNDPDLPEFMRGYYWSPDLTNL